MGDDPAKNCNFQKRKVGRGAQSTTEPQNRLNSAKIRYPGPVLFHEVKSLKSQDFLVLFKIFLRSHWVSSALGGQPAGWAASEKIVKNIEKLWGTMRQKMAILKLGNSVCRGTKNFRCGHKLALTQDF